MFKPLSILLICAMASQALANEAEEYERIRVKGSVPAYQTALSALLSQQQVLDETRHSSDSLANLFNQAPAINLNGQGGLFQTINIRGFARWRIQTLVEGIPIYTERRAGTSVEFLPPDFIQQAHVTTGAASTQLGSGAMGGGIDIYLAQPEAQSIQLDYGSNQDYRQVLINGGNAQQQADGALFWQLSHRHGNNSQDGTGNVIRDQFEQQSVALRGQTDSGLIEEGLFMYSTANNIAKASAEADRFTLYPTNDHLLGKISLDWHNSYVYAHSSKLDTLITRPERRINALRNEALDFGFQSSDVITFDQWQINWRLGSDARQDVSAQETEISITGEPIFDRLNLDAEQLEFYVAADLSANTNSGAYAGGIRVAHHIQRDKLSNASAEDTNFSAFIGYAYPFAKRWKLAGYLSSAYRVPSLTERFFNGATPRGTTLGDADLDTETAQNAELNLAFENKSSRASLSLFTQRIDHYIERLRVDSETRQYRNLNWAEISGINYQWQHAFDWQSLDWTLNLGGQWIRGEDQASADIADIPPAQHRISMRAQHENSQGFVALTHRQSSDHQVDGELPTSAVTTIDAGYSHTITANIQLSLKFTNLTDKLYITLRDDVAPYARGRDVHLSMEYRF